MNNYYLCIFILNMIVLIVMTSVLIFLIVHIYKMYFNLVSGGQFDRGISKREEKKENKSFSFSFLHG